MADISEKFAADTIKLVGSDLTGVETNYLAVDANGSVQSKIVDSTGLAIDSLNTGSGLNALNIAFAGTNYVVSSGNSTTAQLASLATFTGTIENTFNQQALSILITSDQAGTLTLKQYSDAAGTSKVPDIVFTHPAGGFSRSITLNGNYTNIVYKNTGFATTTTLKIDAAFGILPATTTLGNAQVSLDEINGTSITPRPDGYLRVAIDPTGLLYDNFETLDTTNTWAVGGTTAPTGTAGNLVVSAGTAANGTSYAKSIPTFQPSSSGYLQMADLIALEAGAVTGNKRFWGLGVYVTPTLTVPVTNGSVFETDQTTGNLLASTYSNSVRTNSVQVTRPADGLQHRYAIYYKASRVYFELDNVQVASISFPNPQVSTLSTVIGSVNGASVLGTAAVLQSSLIGLADTGKNATQNSDGRFPWRKQTVNADGSTNVRTLDGSINPTYTATITGLAAAAAATDVFIINGSATKTIRITKIMVSGNQATGSYQNLQIIKRSTANTGTSTAASALPYDSADAAATASVKSYIANPTVGTAVGVVDSVKIPILTPTGANSTGVSETTEKFVYGEGASRSLVLRGTSEGVAVNFVGQTMTGSSLNIKIEWTEES